MQQSYNLPGGEHVRKSYELMKGAVDCHCHFAPFAKDFPRPGVAGSAWDAVELAGLCKDAGMKAIVLMDNVFPSVKDAYYANKMVPEVQTLGGITLNKSVGALNATAAGYAIRLGAKYVKLFSLANRVWPKLRKLYPGRLLPGHDPFTILNGDGALIPEAKELLKVVADGDITLVTGHTTVEETFAVIDYAKTCGIERIVVTHVESPFIGHIDKEIAPGVPTPCTIEDQKEMARKGAWIEHASVTCDPIMEVTFGVPVGSAVKLFEAIRQVGPEHCLLATDGGYSAAGSPPECMRVFIQLMLDYGLTEEEIRKMSSENPIRAFGMG
jgi:hypothetical protein